MNDRPSQASTHGNLAVAYQALGAHDRALQHYLHHLAIARELRDTQSEARALGKLHEREDMHRGQDSGKSDGFKNVMCSLNFLFCSKLGQLPQLER